MEHLDIKSSSQYSTQLGEQLARLSYSFGLFLRMKLMNLKSVVIQIKAKFSSPAESPTTHKHSSYMYTCNILLCLGMHHVKYLTTKIVQINIIIERNQKNTHKNMFGGKSQILI